MVRRRSSRAAAGIFPADQGAQRSERRRVATARKIATLIWNLLTKDEPYRWARPAFVAMKMRKLALRAGAPKAHGNKPGPGRDYWIKEIRRQEMELVANAEAAYARMIEAWQDRPPKPKPS